MSDRVISDCFALKCELVEFHTSDDGKLFVSCTGILNSIGLDAEVIGEMTMKLRRVYLINTLGKNGLTIHIGEYNVDQRVYRITFHKISAKSEPNIIGELVRVKNIDPELITFDPRKLCHFLENEPNM